MCVNNVRGQTAADRGRAKWDDMVSLWNSYSHS